MLRLKDFDAQPWGKPKEWHDKFDSAKIVGRGPTETIGDGPGGHYIYMATVAISDSTGMPTVMQNRKGDVLVITYVTE